MTIVVTSETGGTAQSVGVTYVPPQRQVVDAESSTALAAAGVNAAFVADLLSACVAHERCGTHLYRSVAGRTADAELRGQYEHFGEETQEHVSKLEQLIAAAGGDPQYVSASARATEKAAAGLLESTYLLDGSIDPMTAELAMLEAVMLAEAKDRGNWLLLAELAAQMAAGDLRTQFETVTADVLAQEEQHHTWASDTRTRLLLSLAVGEAIPADTGSTSASEATRDELYARAQELDVPRRSQMNKAQLQAAVEEQEGEPS
jgi:ferritin-like metal-binding protein YciE